MPHGIVICSIPLRSNFKREIFKSGIGNSIITGMSSEMTLNSFWKDAISVTNYSSIRRTP